MANRSLVLLFTFLYYPFWIVPELLLMKLSGVLGLFFTAMLGVPVLLVLARVQESILGKIIVSIKRPFETLARDILQEISGAPINRLVILRWFAQGQPIASWIRRLGAGVYPLRRIVRKITIFMSPLYNWIDEDLSTDVETGFLRISRVQACDDSPRLRDARNRTRGQAYLAMKFWLTCQVYILLYPTTPFLASIAVSLVEGGPPFLLVPLLDNRTLLIMYAFIGLAVASAVLIPRSLSAGLKQRRDYLVEAHRYLQRRLAEAE